MARLEEVPPCNRTDKLGWEWLDPTTIILPSAKPVPKTRRGRIRLKDPPALAPISPAAQNVAQPKYGATA
ncbi:MAG: hypothetical protein QW160_04485 [Candidatus Bathyarchaeia archaeon]